MMKNFSLSLRTKQGYLQLSLVYNSTLDTLLSCRKSRERNKTYRLEKEEKLAFQRQFYN